MLRTRGAHQHKRYSRSDIYTVEASAHVKPTLEDERKLKQMERSVEKNADSLSCKRWISHYLILIWTWNTPKMQSPREKLVQTFYVRKWSERTRGRLLRVKQGLRENPWTVCSWPEGNGLNSYRGFLRSTMEWTQVFLRHEKEYQSSLSLLVHSCLMQLILLYCQVWASLRRADDSYRHLMEDEGRLGQKAGDMLCSWGEVLSHLQAAESCSSNGSEKMGQAELKQAQEA